MVVVAKFEDDAVTLYTPIGRFGIRYSTLSFAVVSYFTPVSTFVASTRAPGITAPVLSRTVPTRSPLMTCAATWELTARPKTTANRLNQTTGLLKAIFT